MMRSGRISVRPFVLTLIGFICLLGSLLTTALQADDAGAEADDADTTSEQSEDSEEARISGGGAIGGNNQDPGVMLEEIKKSRTEQRSALFKVSPLKPLHDATDNWSDEFYKKTNVDVGTSIHHLFQWLSESFEGEDDWGTGTDVDIIARWDVLNRGKPNQSSITFHLESRWNWGTTGPMALGAGSLGMLQNTGNTFDKYVPVTIIRNFYWQTGGAKSKGAIRAGKITPDGIFGTTMHLTPNTACLSFACTGGFAIGVPDSGLGVVGAWHVTDRFKILGAITDSNASRFDWGDIGEGDFFTAIDFGVKIWPITEKAGYSHFTLWHNDGTATGAPNNGSNGPEGWGYHFLHEQELTRDGNLVAVLKYGRSMKESAFYERQATAALVMYEPHWFGSISHDSVGIAYDMIQAVTEGARREHGVELWYRFPLFPSLQTTLHYQAIINPSLDPTNDFASAFSIRFTTAF